MRSSRAGKRDYNSSATIISVADWRQPQTLLEIHRRADASVNINSVRIASVTSDEPNNSAGDGNTTNDIVIASDCRSAQLRAERRGGGNGRVYTITFKVTDSSGNSSTAQAKVTVPKSQNGSSAIDDGPHYTVTGCP